MKQLFLLTLLCLAQAAPARAQAVPDSDFKAIARRGIDRVYNLDFEPAERDFQRLVRMEPGNPAGQFFLAMVIWWRIMIDIDDERHDRQFFDALDGVIEMCDSLLEKNPNDVNAIFFKGGAVGFEGRLRFHREDYLGAANAGRKALPLVRDASALDPGNYDILLGSGIYNYYAEVIPQEYPFVKPLILFVPPGDRQLGLRQLTLAAEKGTYASVEASYFLLQIYYFYEKDYGRALALAEHLFTRFPNNVVFHRYCGRAEVTLNNWERAGEVFAEIAGRAQQGKPGYGPAVEREAQYYLGMSAMTGGRFGDALGHFYRCDELSRALDGGEASGFMAMANLKVGMLYDLQGKRELAVEQYRKVVAMKDYKDSRSQAEQFMKSPYAQ